MSEEITEIKAEQQAERRRPAHRPLKFNDPEALQAKIDLYFEATLEQDWTWTGLALALDTDKEVLTSYKHRPDFSDSIKRAMLKVENGYEKDLKHHGRTGTIFALKNFDWKDRQETDITTKGRALNDDLTEPQLDAILERIKTRGTPSDISQG